MKTKKTPNIAIITQARVGSTRLPGKTLLKIGEKNLLQYHLERLQMSKLKVLLATTPESDAKKLIETAALLNIKSTIGPLDDVLSRFYICAKKNNLDIVIRVTSDCPLIDGEIIADAVNTFLNLPDWEYSYLSNTQHRLFPRGFDFEIFSFRLLEEAHLNGLEMFEREHVTPYIYKNSNSKAKIIHYNTNLLATDKSGYRITVDTPEDFKLIEFLIKDHQADQKDFLGIINVLDNNPELAKINMDIVQKPL